MQDIKKTVKDTIVSRRLIGRGDYVLLGLSGGPDSLCLLHILLELKNELGFELSAVHINHGIRGKEADEDADWVVAHCSQVGVSCTRVQANVPLYAEKLHLTEEEAGRKVRREIFGYIAYGLLADEAPKGHPATPLRNAYRGPGGVKARPKAVKIALAHNLDDQAETVMMRILRGTGVHGLAGIQYQSPMNDALSRLAAAIKRSKPGEKQDDPELTARKNKQVEELKTLDISIIRPLLDVARADIEEYCTEKQLQPRIDHTNQEAEYTRNKIRLELLPCLEQNYNPNIKQTLVRLAANAAEDDAALEDISAAALLDAEKILSPAAFRKPAEPAPQSAADGKGSDAPQSGADGKGTNASLLDSISLDARRLRSLQPAVFKRIIVSEFEKLGLLEGISAVHLNALYAAVQKNIGGKTIEFPGGHFAELRAGILTLK